MSLAALRRAFAWLLRHPTAVLAAIGAAVLALYRWRARRAESQRDEARRAESEARATTEAVQGATEQHVEGDRTAREIIDAARHEAHAHPEDPEAAGRGADRYARDRYRELRGEGPRRVQADPVREPRHPAAGTAAGATRRSH